MKVPAAAEGLSQEVVSFVQELRQHDLFKLPGVAETIDWAQALTQLDLVHLNNEVLESNLGILLKYQDDLAQIKGNEAEKILADIKARHIND